MSWCPSNAIPMVMLFIGVPIFVFLCYPPGNGSPPIVSKASIRDIEIYRRDLFPVTAYLRDPASMDG